MRTQATPGEDTLLVRPDSETPFRTGTGALQLTQDEYNGVTAFIRELKSGIYVKCAICERFKYNQTTITLDASGVVKCEDCA